MKKIWYERIRLAAVAFSTSVVFATVPAVSGEITVYAQEAQSIEDNLEDGKNTGDEQGNNSGTGIENNSENNTGNNSGNKEGIAPCGEELGGDGISV